MNWTVPNTESLLRRLTKPKGKIDVVLDTDTYNELDDEKQRQAERKSAVCRAVFE